MEYNNQSQQTSHSTPLPPREGQGVGLSMVQLWRMLVRTKKMLRASYKRFCPRNILKLWYAQGLLKADPMGEGIPRGGMEEAVYDVCRLSELEGYEELPSVQLYPRKHRELLRAIIAVTKGIGVRMVDTRALDQAFCQAFPDATPINVGKKKKKDLAY